MVDGWEDSGDRFEARVECVLLAVWPLPDGAVVAAGDLLSSGFWRLSSLQVVDQFDGFMALMNCNHFSCWQVTCQVAKCSSVGAARWRAQDLKLTFKDVRDGFNALSVWSSMSTAATVQASFWKVNHDLTDARRRPDYVTDVPQCQRASVRTARSPVVGELIK